MSSFLPGLSKESQYKNDWFFASQRNLLPFLMALAPGNFDLFWEILGSWENLRCSGEISPPGKTELFLRNFCSPVKMSCSYDRHLLGKLSCSYEISALLWKWAVLTIGTSWENWAVLTKFLLSCEKWAVLMEKRTCSGVVPPSCQI